MSRVLIYKSDLLPYSETFIVEQVKALRRWQATVVGLRRIPGLSLDELSVHLLLNDQSSDFRRLPLKFASQIRWLPEAIVSPLRSLKPALVHAHFGTEAHFASIIASKLSVPLLVTLHGFDIYGLPSWWKAGHAGFFNRFYPRQLASVIACGARFLAVSNSIRQEAIARGVPPQHIITHHIGINTQAFNPGVVPMAARAPTVLFVGRLVEKKGGEILIQAFARVNQQLPEATLLIAGDGPQRSLLTAMARELGVNINFLGAVPSSDMPNLMHTARVLCLPSITAHNGDAEGFGMVLLEAQACGLPVITSAKGGAEEGLIHNETGYAFAEGDIPDLANHLLRLLSDTNLCAQMGANARQFVTHNFDIKRHTRRLEAHYDAIVSGAL